MPSPQTLHGSYPGNGGFETGLTVGEATGAMVSAEATVKAIKKAKQMNWNMISKRISFQLYREHVLCCLYNERVEGVLP